MKKLIIVVLILLVGINGWAECEHKPKAQTLEYICPECSINRINQNSPIINTKGCEHYKLDIIEKRLSYLEGKLSIMEQSSLKKKLQNYINKDAI